MNYLRFLAAHLAALGAVATGAFSLSGCGGGASAAPGVPNPPTNTNLNRIAFSSNRAGDFEIYTMNPDGSDVQRVTSAAGDDTKPAWSRDKTKLAFASERDGNSEIYVVPIANGKPNGPEQRITNDAAFDGAPSWNPDGTQLVFESDRATRNSTDAITALERAIYVVDTTDKNVRRITQHPGFTDQNPSWSPQGNLIVLQSNDADFSKFRPQAPDHLFTVEPTGQNFKQLTFGGRNQDRTPSWDASGTKILYEFFGVFLIEPSTGNIATLREAGIDLCFTPSFSPDGKAIVCSSQGVLSTFKIEDSTGILTKITDANSISVEPTW